MRAGPLILARSRVRYMSGRQAAVNMTMSISTPTAIPTVVQPGGWPGPDANAD